MNNIKEIQKKLKDLKKKNKQISKNTDDIVVKCDNEKDIYDDDNWDECDR